MSVDQKDSQASLAALQRLMSYASEEFRRHGHRVASDLCILAQIAAEEQINRQQEEPVAPPTARPPIIMGHFQRRRGGLRARFA